MGQIPTGFHDDAGHQGERGEPSGIHRTSDQHGSGGLETLGQVDAGFTQHPRLAPHHTFGQG